MDSTFDYIKSINLNDVQKRALFKIAVDMVKIDNRIHSKEVSILDNLQSTCGISSEEIELIHYIPLQRAISALKSLSEKMFLLIQADTISLKSCKEPLFKPFSDANKSSVS